MKKHRLKRSHLHDGSLILALLSAWLMTPLWFGIGMALFLAGMGLQIWSKATLRRNRELAMNGPYALCRHPFYLGNALFDLGICAMSGNYLLVLAYPVVFYFAYGPTIRAEEARTRRHFGEAHEEFRRTTPLFFPFSPRFFRDWRTAVSWKNLVTEMEISRTIRHATYPVLLLIASRVFQVLETWRWRDLLDVIFWEVALVLLAFALSLLFHRYLEKSETEYHRPGDA